MSVGPYKKDARALTCFVGERQTSTAAPDFPLPTEDNIV